MERAATSIKYRRNYADASWLWGESEDVSSDFSVWFKVIFRDSCTAICTVGQWWWSRWPTYSSIRIALSLRGHLFGIANSHAVFFSVNKNIFLVGIERPTLTTRLWDNLSRLTSLFAEPPFGGWLYLHRGNRKDTEKQCTTRTTPLYIWF